VLNISLARLRILGYIEGVSFLLLLGVAMPLKYLAGQPGMVSIVGMIHGLLFLLYVGGVFQVGLARSWPLKRIFLASLAAVLPFGPFVLDGHLREEVDASVQSVPGSALG
jgi:integral membrane protein